MGDVLDKLGYKKSEFIVLAVAEYLKINPDITPDGGQKINIIVRPSFTREQIEVMVKDAIREQLAGIEFVSPTVDKPSTEPKEDDPGIDLMIKNLEMFTQT